MKLINRFSGLNARILQALIVVMFMLSFAGASTVRADALPNLRVQTACISYFDAAANGGAGAHVCIPSPSIDPGEAIEITYTLENTGAAAAVSNVSTDIFIDNNPNDFIDPDLGNWGNVINQLLSDYFFNLQPAMGAGSTYTDTIVISAGLTPGIHQIWVYVDASGNDAEENEYDNSLLLSNVTVSVQTATITSTGSQDGWIMESAETSNAGGTLNTGASKIFLGDDSLNRQYLGILSFDTSILPDDAVIYSATLSLKYGGVSGSLPFTFNSNNYLAADVRRGEYSSNPAVELKDFKNGNSKGGVLFFPNVKVSNWYSKSFAPANFTYINLLGVTQFRLRFQTDDNNNMIADYLKIYSGNAGKTWVRPKFVIEYYVP